MRDVSDELKMGRKIMLHYVGVTLKSSLKKLKDSVKNMKNFKNLSPQRIKCALSKISLLHI